MKSRLYSWISRYAADGRGNVIIIFALALLPMLGVTALAVDYSQSLAVKAKLDTAADAAAIAGITAAKNYMQNYSGAGSVNAQAIAAGNAAARYQFNANAGSFGGGTNPVQMIASSQTPYNGNYVAISGGTITGSVSYSYNNPTLLAKLLGKSSVTIANTATSSLSIAKYLNFYLLLDVSGSMAIPSTASEINRLASIDPDYRNLYPGGCILACHFTNYKACQNARGQTIGCQGYILSRNGGNSRNTPVDQTPPYFCQNPGSSACIQLRADAVAYAVQQLLVTAQNTATQPNQFGVGLYPFIAYMDTLQPLTTDLSTVSSSAAGLTDLLDNGDGGTSFTAPNGATIFLGSGGTHFENALPAMSNAIPSNMIGSGLSQGSPLPFVFFVTDGAQDNQYQHGGGRWSGSNNATTIDETLCAQIKNRGITLAVLYIPYVPIPNPTPIWNNEDGAANANIPNIPPSLQSCASPGFFFTASSPSDINSAMQQMFIQSLQAAHLTR